MVAEQVQIGRRSVYLDDFEKAVVQAGKLSDVLVNLGLNKTVATTKRIVKDMIDELGLDTSHFRWNYTMSDAVLSRNRKKQFNLSDDNQKYYDAFEEYRIQVDETSWGTYKATVGNFMEELGKRDFATVTVDDMFKFAEDRNMSNRMSHLRAAMYYIVKNNVNGAFEKVNREMLFWLPSSMDKKLNGGNRND